MTWTSDPALRVLHALRTTGHSDPAALARRCGAAIDDLREHLLDAQAHGWTAVTALPGGDGWVLTERGRAHTQALLVAELDACGARGAVEDAHREFLRWNDAVGAACTQWQLTQLGLTDVPVTPADVVAALAPAADALARIEATVSAHLTRFTGYHRRFRAALDRIADDPEWITAMDRDSCHRVWFELHEDLIATLGLQR